MSNRSTETQLPFSGGDGNATEAHYELFKLGPEPTPVHLGFTLVTIFIVIFGVGSAFIKEKLYAGEAIIATVIGIAFGPYGAGLFNPRTWGGGHDYDAIVLEITRVVIALSVFAVGVELPRAYMLKHWRSLSILLGPVMLVGWLISGALMYGLIPGINFLEALVMAAAVTPTDPILAASVVGKGKFASDHVPSHVRHLLQSESGSNDGAAFPFLYLALFLVLRDTDSVGHSIGSWIYLVLLYQIVLGVTVGGIIGTIARKAMKFAKRRALIDRESMVAMYVALALFSTYVTTIFGSDDLLAAFAAGTAFAWDDWFTESIEESNFSAIIDLLVNSAIFFFVGATMPFDTWSCSGLTLSPWRLVVLGFCILLVRRLPAVYLLQNFIPDIHTTREAVFCGWFGPMGIGALFISTLAATRLPDPSVNILDFCNADASTLTSLDILTLSVQPVTYFIVLLSIIAHGLSIPFFTLSKRVHSISRTWTTTSNQEGPSWLTRVRRVGDPRDIIINRDDDEKAELGEAGQDLGTDIDVRDFITKSSGSDFDGSNEKEGSAPEDEGIPNEEHYPDKEEAGEEVFQEGDKTIIDRHGGEEVEEIEPTGEHKKFESHEPHFADVAEHDNGDNEGPIGRMRRGASRGFSTTAIGSHLRDRVKQFTIGEKYDPAREEEYKKERHDCRVEPSRALREEEPKWWREGHRIVIERGDGEEVQVVDEDPDDVATAAAKVHPHRELIKLPAFGTRQPDKGIRPVRDLTELIRAHLSSAEGDASRSSIESERGRHPEMATAAVGEHAEEPSGLLGRMRRGLSTTAGRAAHPHHLHHAKPEHGPAAESEGMLGRMRRGLSTTAGQNEEGATGRMTRGFSSTNIGPKLANRVKNFTIGSPYDPAREEEYKRERHDGRLPRSPPGAPSAEPKRWRQGNMIVIEHRGGEEIEVVNEDPTEEDKRKAEHHPDRQVIKMPAFMTRARSSSDRAHPPLSQRLKEHLAADRASNPAESTELKPEASSSSGSSKGKERARDCDDISPSDFAAVTDGPSLPSGDAPASPKRNGADSSPKRPESGHVTDGVAHLPTLDERSESQVSQDQGDGNEPARDLRRAVVERASAADSDRGRVGSRSAAGSASNSRNPSPSRGSIRFDVPLTDTQRSGNIRPASQSNSALKERKWRKKGDLKLKRH